MAAEHRWTHNEELLALVLEKLDELVLMTAKVWGAKQKLPKPYRYPRPHAPQRQRPATLGEIRAFFAR